ncbi:unnamed protein product [Brassicogethes aeneus]|uniref:Peptidase S1 domain-containing protein n=1 Tax=Brassicogethes aeneus TaxID=1431903 RepID=A0A9P0BB76_BRAAE|nr:unnamed protein product [Brassicogethes aeneus]
MPTSYGLLSTLFICVVISSEVQANRNWTSTRIKRQAVGCGFQCKSDGVCIDSVQECNGKVDCADGSDETDHCKGTWCPKYLYRCNYGACISKVSVCDGKQDCKDNSDETGPNCRAAPKNETCGNDQFHCTSGECIDPIFQCNGKADCRDKSDETEDCKDIWCPHFVYRCDYGACVNGDAECNGNVDCLDGSDESVSKCGKTPAPPVKITTTEGPPTPRPTPPPTPAPIPKPVTDVAIGGSCVLPDYPDNGRWQLLQGKKYPGQSVEPGTVIVAKCDSGYTLESDSSYSICVGGGVWNLAFNCKLQCPAYTSTNTTFITCTLNNEYRDCARAVDGTYMEINCAPFFENLSSGKYRYCKDGTWDNAKPQCSPACGMKRVRTAALSVGGVPVEKGDYPWQVAIFKKIGDEFSPICGGSMLNTKIILTAAHCMVDENKDGTISITPGNFEVAVGKFYRQYRHPEDKDAQYSPVKEILPSGDYRGSFGSYTSDIALLVVKIEFKPSKMVQPVCRDNSNIIHLTAGQLGVVTGWGYTKHGGEASNELRELVVPFEEDSICRSKLPLEYVHRYYSNDKLCAGFHNNSKSVCEGDSGGGLVFEQNQRYYIRGIVSISPRQDGSCDIQQYTLYTNVNKFNSFIDKTIVKYS